MRERSEIKKMKAATQRVTDDSLNKQFSDNANLMCAFPRIVAPTIDEEASKKKKEQRFLMKY